MLSFVSQSLPLYINSSSLIQFGLNLRIFQFLVKRPYPVTVAVCSIPRSVCLYVQIWNDL